MELPRSGTDGNKVLFLHSNHFCLIGNSEGVSFIQAIKQLKGNFKIVNNSIPEENVSCHFE